MALRHSQDITSKKNEIIPPNGSFIVNQGATGLNIKQADSKES
jgi:hypothetical protein